ncbi:MAG: carbon-nitrogen hydrolase family protein [Desulfobacterales bacterium]|nr:carbon-nitrogen hydrolase family protein [Desulfobacterales bacterium]
MSRLLGLAACQLEVSPGKIEKNLENMAEQIGLIKYYSPWVKLVVTSELCFQGSPNFQEIAQTVPGPITEFCAKIAKDYGIYLIPGSLYEKKADGIYNASPVFDDNGIIVDIYHKMYPWRPHEKTRSGQRTVVFEIPGIGTIGLCNCYDLWFPELIRDLVFKGAEIIFVPTAGGTQDRKQEMVLARAAAIQNQCYVVSVNGVGVGGVGSGGKGNSLIVDPEGNVLQKAGQLRENLISMVDLDNVQLARDHGVAGVSRPLASFFHERHRFSYQDEPLENSPVYPINKLDE